MSRQSPHARGAKKPPQSTSKEKRAAKRAKQQEEPFIKPRKAARG